MKSEFNYDEEFINSIKKGLKEIILNSKEKFVVDKAKETIEYIDRYISTFQDEKENLAISIERSMKQARNRNSEMESILYIIHGDLINSRISVEKAKELYEQYLNLEMFEGRR